MSVVSYCSKQVQHIIGCGKTKFWELISYGEFPNAYKVGRKIMVPESDVEAYRKKNRIVENK